MQMLYNSDSFVVVAFELPARLGEAAGLGDAALGDAALGDAALGVDGRAAAGLAGAGVTVPGNTPSRGGFEIVDKLAGKEIFIQGLVAASFQQGIQALVAGADSQEAALAAVDEFLAGYATLAQQPVRLH